MEPRYGRAAAMLFFLAAPVSAQTPNAAGSPCQQAYNPNYEKPYSLPKSTWSIRCEDGLRPEDIVALGQEWCRDQYDPKKCEPIGLLREVWVEDCQKGLGKQSPSEYLQEKKMKFVLNSPIDKITAEQAYAFNFFMKNDRQPDVVARRAVLEARLAQAGAAWKGLGLSLTQERDFLALPLAETQAQYRALMERFDRARAAAPDSDLAAKPAVRGASPQGAARDTRPLRPGSPSMRGVDRGLDDPEAVKGRLWEEVKSIAARRDGKGLPVYEEKVIKMMEMVVESVPVRKGVPPLTDLVALEDVRQMIAVISKDQTPVAFDPNLDGFGVTTLVKGSDGNWVKAADGEYKRMIKIKPGPPGGKEYSLEEQAGVFIHEISHVKVVLDKGGANFRVNENIAFRRQNRFYSNKRQEFNEAIKAAGADRKKVEELIKSRDSFLSEGHADSLEEFEKDPEDFIYGLVPIYYGEKNEFKPGAVTLAQQMEKAKKEKNKALLRSLAQDEKLDFQSKQEDLRWRQAKRADCDAFLDQDAESQAILKERQELEEKRLAKKLKKKAAVKIELRLVELEEANMRIMENHESCRVN